MLEEVVMTVINGEAIGCLVAARVLPRGDLSDGKTARRWYSLTAHSESQGLNVTLEWAYGAAQRPMRNLTLGMVVALSHRSANRHSLADSNFLSAGRNIAPMQNERNSAPTHRATAVVPVAQARRRWMSTEASTPLKASSKSTLADKPYMITTPIFYVNADPHIGHLYTLVLSDILKRWRNIKEPTRPVRFLTGVDEHGMKIQQAAANANVHPATFCDHGAKVFADLVEHANISNTDFVRTTDREHIESVQHCWRVLRDGGHIYENKHEGWYSVSDETFYPQAYIEKRVDPPTGRIFIASKETGKEVEWTSERNYHFKLSAFKQPLLDYYEKNPDFIVPHARRNEVVDWVTNNLEDLSISRPRDRLSWGIPVPGDETQTIYVWLDALTNYINKVGYPWPPQKKYAGGWPADLQIIGKDIIRFHCIYWPAFLMALGLSPPKQILVHAHWTMNKQKMSKSTGNVVNPFFAIDRWGLDAVRYFLARDGGILNDGDYDNERVDLRYRDDLKATLGNLFSRVVKFKPAPLGFAVEAARRGDFSYGDAATAAQKQLIDGLYDAVDRKFTELDPPAAFKLVREAVGETNKFLQAQAPWVAVKAQDGRIQAAETIYLCSEMLRVAAILLQPVMPTKASQMLDQLGVAMDRRSASDAVFGADLDYGTVDQTTWENYGVIFPQISAE